MNGRLPYAMETLLKELEAHCPRFVYQLGELDGFGVYRRLDLDEDATALLQPMLDRPLDGRLIEARYDGGLLSLWFVLGPAADDRSPWGLGS